MFIYLTDNPTLNCIHAFVVILLIYIYLFQIGENVFKCNLIHALFVPRNFCQKLNQSDLFKCNSLFSPESLVQLPFRHFIAVGESLFLAISVRHPNLNAPRIEENILKLTYDLSFLFIFNHLDVKLKKKNECLPTHSSALGGPRRALLYKNDCYYYSRHLTAQIFSNIHYSSHITTIVKFNLINIFLELS